MKFLNIIFTHNRNNVMIKSLDSIFNNTLIKADKTIIIDDNSNEETKQYLLNFINENKSLNIDLFTNNQNEGYARNYWKAFNLLKFYNPEYVFFIESDYIFRKNYLEECFELFDKLPDLFAVKGFAHKEYYNRAKIIPWFRDATIEKFNEPLRSWQNLYQPLVINTKYGNIQYMYGSHACGTILLNWEKINSVSTYNIDRHILRACKNNEYNNIINDGFISCLYAKIWDDYFNLRKNRNNESGIAFVSDVSIATHLNSGGINHDGILEEGYSTVTANFPEDYKNFKR